jgi:hypothetical protein
MNRKIALTAMLAFVASFGMLSPSYAEDAQQAFTALIGRGFKIVGTFLAMSDKQERLAIITLQMDKSVAVCTFALANWENTTSDSLADAKGCDVRFY